MMTERAERADLFATIRAAAAIDGPCTLTYPQVNVLQRLLVQVFELLDDYRDKSLPPASPGAGGDPGPTVTTWRLAVEGLLHEWDKLTRYGSPMAKGANEAVAYARKLIAMPDPAPAAVADAEFRKQIEAVIPRIGMGGDFTRDAKVTLFNRLWAIVDPARALASSAQKDGV